MIINRQVQANQFLSVSEMVLSRVISYISFLALWNEASGEFLTTKEVSVSGDCLKSKQENIFLQTECVLRCQRLKKMAMIHENSCYCVEEICSSLHAGGYNILSPSTYHITIFEKVRNSIEEEKHDTLAKTTTTIV